LKRAAEGSNGPETQLALADYYVGQKRDAEARPILEGLLAKKDTQAAAGARLAAIERAAGNPAAAYKRLQGIIDQQPNNAQLLAVRSGWLLADGKVGDALTGAEAATKADGGVVDGWLALGSVHLARNDNAAAAKAFQEAIRVKPDNEKALVALAGLNIRAGKNSEAVKISPGSGSARYMLARALLAQGKPADAENILKPLLAVQPPSATVLVLHSQIQQRGGDTAGARKSVERALSIDPNSGDALSTAIGLELAAKNVSGAVKHVEAAVAKAPNSAPTLLTAGRTYAMARDFAKAEQSLMDAYNMLGQVLAAQNRLDDAKHTYEAQLAKEPNNVAASTMVGMIYAAQGNMTLARAAFEKAVSIDPRAAVASNNLAYLDAEAGVNLDVALNRVQTAKAAQPDDPDVNDTLGWVYVKRGLPALAVSPLEQAIQKKPAEPTYHYHLGMAYLKSGDKDQARSALERALRLSPSFQGAVEAKRALDTLGR
jgi:tetratricopeptide (TPR) repeat protein